ncbi:hypothetical protein FACS18949_16010 [Clostridia bacterium]|nr:hypothetical protein FACS18949_16010 [Clostridia bacterium]
MNAVLDTNVLVSALLTPGGNAWIIVEAFTDYAFGLFYSPKIFDEYAGVLSRPKFGFERSLVSALLTAVKQNGVCLYPPVSITTFEDESDRKFYDCALCGNACLVTGNIKHFPVELFIITPKAFAAMLP